MSLGLSPSGDEDEDSGVDGCDDQTRSETSLCSHKNSTRVKVVQNRREPPTKPRIGLRNTTSSHGVERWATLPFAHDSSHLSSRQDEGDLSPLKILVARYSWFVARFTTQGGLIVVQTVTRNVNWCCTRCRLCGPARETCNDWEVRKLSSCS